MLPYRTQPPRDWPNRSQPRGFTLVELLVVVGIMIALTTMTLYMVNVTQDEDRVRAGAAQVRSFLEGARDRAIHAKEPRGVRFIMDPNLPNTVSSMLYIGPPEKYKLGRLRTASDDRTINFEFEMDTNPNTPDIKAEWNRLRLRTLLPSQGAVIFLGDTQQFYTVDWDGTNYVLTKDFVSAPMIPGSPTTYYDYSLQLNPAVLPNQEPRTFPRDVLIDLANSQFPATWRNLSGNFISELDILFSPHGTVTGLAASAGVINLVVAEGVDIIQNRPPGATAKEGNERVVSVRTQTGGISVHFVDPTDVMPADGLADDPFSFAASGETAQ